MRTEYRAKILIHDDMGERPRRWVSTDQTFSTQKKAAEFLETFKSWVPVVDTEVVRVGVADCRSCSHRLDENVVYCPMCGTEAP